MKKILIAITLSALLLGASCSKQNGNKPASTEHNVAMTLAAETTGSIHNDILSDYFATYGVQKNVVITKEQSYTIIKRCGELLKAKYPEIDAVFFDLATEKLFSKMVENGYYVDGKLISVAEINSKNIALVENESLKAALNNINSYSGSDFVAYNTNKLNSLSLIGKDADLRDALVSIGNSSHFFWGGYWPGGPDELNNCARADEYAFIFAYCYLFDDLFSPVRETASAGYAAGVSYKAYLKYGY